ncbi:threonyl-tRNA synthetase-like protein [Plenodomus tracheiphilus IPT5]|uniref:threonine--tRNA ligase n=1 Tax=Plenodomus tracheiphilus IPT5 TaxID=1408161 RepID=A0A6A7B1K0_9PLEO|nr:threonyl-tRNA synthetase-like protein [Plenodomus tracheiphilus IPT5]
MADAVKDIVNQAAEGVKNLAVSAEQKAPKPKKEKKPKGDGGDGRPLMLEPAPAYIDHRIQIFDKLKAKYDEEIAQKPREDISITLEDGKIIGGKSWETSPADIARNISKSLFERTVVARLDKGTPEETLWDLERPLEKSCKLELLPFDHPEGKKVFWHSSAHILGEASERRYGCDLCIGPPIEDGFYYEMALPDGAAVEQSDHKPLETIVNSIVKEKQVFQRLTLSKDDLLEMFKSNKYKQHIIKDKIPDGTFTTVYRNGPLIDLCRGPHVPHTGRIKQFKVMKNSASYFLGDAANDSLQRIYGVSFPDKDAMQAHLKFLEEAAKRDHRKIGKEQELFFFHEFSPGSCFFLPHGQIIYNTLQAFLREEYWNRGYQEVGSPNMYNSALWKISGHWQHYADDMFTFDVEKEKWALKPMNCPGHCLIFKHRERSYRELPIRMADFGILHRNEASGALTGLTRVRRFQQDDTHVFCTQDQINEEILALFDFLKAVYGKFGFTFKLKLSTRPEGFLGDIDTWNKAEAKLTQALDEFTAGGGGAWELNPGDGAFYGPKIDITISDALKREFQCATIQLDFQLPNQFELEYMTSESAAAKPKEEKVKAEQQKGEKKAEQPKQAGHIDQKKDNLEGEVAIPKKIQPPQPGYARPVMIHRAIYGSFERFIAILTEHFAGRWPFWLSPRQVMVIPVMPSANDYVKEVQAELRKHHLHADIDISGNTMQKKIRTAQLSLYNFIMVVGAEEQKARAVNWRNRDDQETQQRGEIVPLDEAVKKLVQLRDERRFENKV